MITFSFNKKNLINIINLGNDILILKPKIKDEIDIIKIKISEYSKI